MKTPTKVCTRVIAFALLLCASAHTQEKPVSDSLQDALFNEEHELAKAEKQQEKSFFEERLDDKLIYVAYNGLVLTKAKIVASLNYIDVSRYTIRNMKVRSLGPDVGLVTYDLVLNGNLAGREFPEEQYAASVWRKQSDTWLLVFHQSTPARH